MNFISDFFSNNFENCVWLAVMLVALIPTLETKISIPLALNTDIWGGKAFSPISALFLSFFASILPCFIIMLVTRKIKKHTAGFLTNKFLYKYSAKSAKIENKKGSFKKYLALAVFVAIPLPLTGVWSGSIIAGISNLDLKKSFLAISLGSLVSCSIITILCTFFSNSISNILLISFLIIIVFLIADFILSFYKKNK